LADKQEAAVVAVDKWETAAAVDKQEAAVVAVDKRETAAAVDKQEAVAVVPAAVGMQSARRAADKKVDMLAGHASSLRGSEPVRQRHARDNSALRMALFQKKLDFAPLRSSHRHY
jgi:hypothetical protein